MPALCNPSRGEPRHGGRPPVPAERGGAGLASALPWNRQRASPRHYWSVVLCAISPGQPLDRSRQPGPVNKERKEEHQRDGEKERDSDLERERRKDWDTQRQKEMQRKTGTLRRDYASRKINIKKKNPNQSLFSSRPAALHGATQAEARGRHVTVPGTKVLLKIKIEEAQGCPPNRVALTCLP